MSLVNEVKPAAALEAIIELKDSLGWALIRDFLDSDSASAIMDIGDNPNMKSKEIHYRRGKINATSGFKTLPDKLKLRFEGEAPLEASLSKTQVK